MIEGSSLMPQHNGRGSLSSTSLVNQYRVPISRETEERIEFSYMYYSLTDLLIAVLILK